MLPKREWAEMTWQDFTASDTARWIAVLPLAATEQHGPHLPLGVDSFIAEAYLGRVRALVPADLPVSFLPVQKIGQSDEHRAFPGTLTLSGPTVIRAWTEIGESVARAGVKKLVLVTSHGGNVAAMEILRGDHSVLSHELRRYSRAGLAALLTGAGFTIDRITYTNAILFPPMAMARAIQRARGLSGEHEADQEITVPPAVVNTLLRAALKVESVWLRAFNNPFGSSLLCLARKPG